MIVFWIDYPVSRRSFLKVSEIVRIDSEYQLEARNSGSENGLVADNRGRDGRASGDLLPSDSQLRLLRETRYSVRQTDPVFRKYVGDVPSKNIVRRDRRKNVQFGSRVKIHRYVRVRNAHARDSRPRIDQIHRREEFRSLSKP